MQVRILLKSVVELLLRGDPRGRVVDVLLKRDITQTLVQHLRRDSEDIVKGEGSKGVDAGTAGTEIGKSEYEYEKEKEKEKEYKEVQRRRTGGRSTAAVELIVLLAHTMRHGTHYDRIITHLMELGVLQAGKDYLDWSNILPDLPTSVSVSSNNNNNSNNNSNNKGYTYKAPKLIVQSTNFAILSLFEVLAEEEEAHETLLDYSHHLSPHQHLSSDDDKNTGISNNGNNDNNNNNNNIEVNNNNKEIKDKGNKDKDMSMSRDSNANTFTQVSAILGSLSGPGFSLNKAGSDEDWALMVSKALSIQLRLLSSKLFSIKISGESDKTYNCKVFLQAVLRILDMADSPFVQHQCVLALAHFPLGLPCDETRFGYMLLHAGKNNKNSDQRSRSPARLMDISIEMLGHSTAILGSASPLTASVNVEGEDNQSPVSVFTTDGVAFYSIASLLNHANTAHYVSVGPLSQAKEKEKEKAALIDKKDLELNLDKDKDRDKDRDKDTSISFDYRAGLSEAEIAHLQVCRFRSLQVYRG